MIHKLAVPGPIEDVEEVRVLEWHSAAGRTVNPDELIVEIETYKAIVEVRAAQPGCCVRSCASQEAGKAWGSPSRC
jgi:pyruvate/2-oxoglutarate dehydrogenase complex dihydrolipoamide acyltransferase (E2) component